MTHKIFKFTRRLLMVLSAALSFALILFLQMSLSGAPHV